MGDCSGDAVVEATILFPIMILIFAALVLLSLYLPVQATLQRATQYAATAIATENSDTWLTFDEVTMSYQWRTHRSELRNVYVELFSGSRDVQRRAEELVTYVESRGISLKSGELTVTGNRINRILYREVIVTATREFPVIIDLSFIGFPNTISVSATARALVADGDEFVRTITLATEFASFISERYELDNITTAIGDFGNRVKGILGVGT